MIKRIYIYILANLILLFGKYDKKYFISGRWFRRRISAGSDSLGWYYIVAYHKTLKMAKGNKNIPWPCHPSTQVLFPQNVKFHPDNLDNFLSPGCYFQAVGKIEIGHGTYIAQNVGIITANHNFTNLDEHQNPKDVIIGENCWIGMNSVILPGVVLGNNTIVGAGSIVTKSFPNGHCVIGGNPAKLIKNID